MTAPPPPKAIAPLPPMLEQQASLNPFSPRPYPVAGWSESKTVETPAPVANIAKAISAVMSEIGVVAKEGVNQFHRYKYATIGDVLHKLTPLLGKHGLMIVQNEVSSELKGTRLAVVYEFSIAHSSGEVWPDKPRKTGMTIAADSKGNFDDKAFNKAATAARKYFLLELFQVPTGDMEDADSDATGAAQSPPPPPSAPRQHAPAPPPPIPVDESKPHRIVLGKGSGADRWAEAFIKAIGSATTNDEINEWGNTNHAVLDNLQTSHGDLYTRVMAAMGTKRQELNPEVYPTATDEIPDPAADPDACINAIAQHLNDVKSYEEGEEWFNRVVAPMEDKFFPPDFQLLIDCYRRMEEKFKT